MLSRDLTEKGSKTRVIIYSGKGGTGKTTISSSTAVLWPGRGKKC